MVLMHPNVLQAAMEEVCHTDWSEWPKGDGHHFLLFCTLLESYGFRLPDFHLLQLIEQLFCLGS